MNGYIKLHRQLLENPVVMKDSDYLAVWIYLLLNATHKDIKGIFGKETITLKPGQLLTGRTKISNDLNIQSSKVERILKKLEIERQIEQQTCNKGRLISLINWNLYQESEQQNEQQVNNKRTTSEQQVNTNKNERMKECKNVRNIYTDDDTNILTYYESNVATLSPIAAEKIIDLEKDYGTQKVKEAINRSVLNNKKSLNYIIGILKSWGDKSWDEILEEEQNFKNNKNIKKGEIDWDRI